jgi:microcystin degradation protein MlrC
VATPLAAFEPHYDAAARQAQQGMRTAMAAFLDAAQALGAECVTPLSATANPSGPVQAQAYDALTERIVEAAAAAATPSCWTCTAPWWPSTATTARAICWRACAPVAPGVPIGVALDLHGNITERMVAHADVMVGFKTYPTSTCTRPAPMWRACCWPCCAASATRCAGERCR